MASRPKRDLRIDPMVLMDELARLIEQQSLLAFQVRVLAPVEKELFRVRGKRIGVLLAALKGCETMKGYEHTHSPQELVGSIRSR